MRDPPYRVVPSLGSVNFTGDDLLVNGITGDDVGRWIVQFCVDTGPNSKVCVSTAVRLVVTRQQAFENCDTVFPDYDTILLRVGWATAFAGGHLRESVFTGSHLEGWFMGFSVFVLATVIQSVASHERSCS